MILVFMALILFPSLSQSHGNRVGNGGDAWVCSSGAKIESATLLDLKESDRKLKTVEGEDPYSVAQKLLEDLRPKHEKLVKLYQKRLSEMEREVEFIKLDEELQDIKDSKHLKSPKNKNCTIKQVAIRKNKISTGEKRFMIDPEIWNKMPINSKAGLLLHEIVYEHFYQLGEEDSLKARKFVSFLTSEDVTTYSDKQYEKFLHSLEVPIYR